MTGSETASPGAARGRSLARSLDRHWAVAFVLPALVVLVAVTAIPFISALGLSFTNFNLNKMAEARFIGADNYVAFAGDAKLQAVLVTTIVLVAAIVVLETLTGMGLALVLNREFRGIGLIRSIDTLPLMVTAVVVAITWRALFNTNVGWINYFLGLVGLPTPNWLGDPLTALPAIVIADIWVGTPFMAVLILAGLIGVSKELKEAAAVDGANSWSVFRYVSLPAIRPVLVVAILLRTVDAFRKFESITVMTKGGPGTATTILNLYVYETSFLFGKLGYGAALAVLLVLLMSLVLFLFYRFSRESA